MDQAILDVMAEIEMRNEREKLRGIAGGIDALDADAAKLLYIMALGGKAKSIVEVGTGVGYSTLWLGAAAKTLGGKVVTCENDPTRAAEARTNLEKAGLSGIVEILPAKRCVTRMRRLICSLLTPPLAIMKPFLMWFISSWTSAA